MRSRRRAQIKATRRSILLMSYSSSAVSGNSKKRTHKGRRTATSDYLSVNATLWQQSLHSQSLEYGVHNRTKIDMSTTCHRIGKKFLFCAV
jgi:hypothetical protein